MPRVDGAITSCPSTLMRRSRTQHVAVVDALGPGHHGVHQGGHFAARTSVPGTVTEVDQLVGPGHQVQPLGQHGGQRQARSGHRPVVVEGHGKACRIVGFCVHRKDAFLLGDDVYCRKSHLPKTGGIFRVWSDLRSPGQGWDFGGSRLKRPAKPIHLILGLFGHLR